MKKFFDMLCLAVMFAATGEARGGVITFDGGAPNNSTPAIWQTAYDTSIVDVQFNSGYFSWNTAYNDLVNVAYGPTLNPLIIDFVALGGFAVQLNSFDLGNYLGRADQTRYKIFDLANLATPVIDSGDFTVTYSATSHPTFNVNYTSFTGIRIELKPDFGQEIGIDNISFTGVPEPVTMAIWGIGACGIGLVTRRKKMQSV